MDSVEYREQLENRHDERGRSAESAAREAADGLRGALEALADEWERAAASSHTETMARAMWVGALEGCARQCRAVLAAHPADAPEAPEPSGDVVELATQVLLDAHGADIKAHALRLAGLLGRPGKTEVALRYDLGEALVERDEARAEVERHRENTRRGWQSSEDMRKQRDRAEAEARAARQEVERLRDALREFVDSRGVNVGELDSEWYRGYRQAQRECLLDARKIDAALSDEATRSSDAVRAEAIEAAARATATYWQDEVAAPDECDREAGKAAVAAAVPHLLAPIRALHQPEERCHDGEGTWSVTREVWETDFRGHDWLDDPVVFLVCAECGDIEMHVSRGQEHGDSYDYLDALWPCATARALDQIEGALR